MEIIILPVVLYGVKVGFPHASQRVFENRVLRRRKWREAENTA
jgi:hypothetical protein